MHIYWRDKLYIYTTITFFLEKEIAIKKNRILIWGVIWSAHLTLLAEAENQSVLSEYVR